MVYFLAQYKDPTDSVQRGPWVKQADGSWQKLKDPNDKGGDNNLYYEDKMAVIWDISSPAFEQRGCFSACHTGEGKPFGNKYTKDAGERLDMWHFKSVRTGSVGQTDDQYVDATRYDPDKSPNAGRKTEPKTGGGYVDNVSDDKKGPKFALKGNKPAPPYWIVDTNKEPFDDSKYKAGDEVPGIVVAPFTGDRGDDGVEGRGVDARAVPQARHEERVRRAVRGPQEAVRLRRGRVRQRPGAARVQHRRAEADLRVTSRG
jgi:hypothetical protein